MNTEPQRKYRKKVNRNGWMARVQRYVTGREPRYMGYCPFFWMTWLCLAGAPFVALKRAVVFTWGFLSEMFSSGDVTTGLNIHKSERPGNYELARYGFEVEDYFKTHPDAAFAEAAGEAYYRVSNLWSYNLQWALDIGHEAFKVAAAEARAAEIKRQERLVATRTAREAREKRLKPYQDAIVRVWSRLVKPLLAISAVALAYFGYKYLFGAIVGADWAAIGSAALGYLWFFAQVIAFILTLIVGGLLIYVLAKAAISLGQASGPKRAVRKVGNFFTGIAVMFSFLIETVAMIYKKECPLIEWGEESGPIEKNSETKE